MEGAIVRGALGLDASYQGPLTGDNLSKCMDFCISLSLGQRQSGNDGGRTFDVDTFRASFHEYKEQYLAGRERFRDIILKGHGAPSGRGLKPEMLSAVRTYYAGQEWPRTYFKNMLEPIGPEGTNIDDKLLKAAADSFPARLAFDQAVVESMLIDGYNVRKHRGDCFDCGILTHLADPHLHLFTGDQKLVERTGPTPQADRILSVRTLLRRNEAG